MSQLEYIDEYAIPTYALPLLINGDDSGLDEDDANEIRQWLEQEFPDHNCLTFDCSGGDDEFSTLPAFGLPTTTTLTKVHGHPKS